MNPGGHDGDDVVSHSEGMLTHRSSSQMKPAGQLTVVHMYGSAAHEPFMQLKESVGQVPKPGIPVWPEAVGFPQEWEGTLSYKFLETEAPGCDIMG